MSENVNYRSQSGRSVVRSLVLQSYVEVTLGKTLNPELLHRCVNVCECLTDEQVAPCMAATAAVYECV